VTTHTFLFISHTTNVLLFKFRYNIFIGVRIIKEMSGSVASGTPCIYICNSNIITIKQLVYYVKNTTVVYNISILLWQHVSAYLRTSSGQRTVYCGIPYYLQDVNEYGIPQYTVCAAFIFDLKMI